MRKLLIALSAAVGLVAPVAMAQGNPLQSTETKPSLNQVAKDHLRSPRAFMENKGQWDSRALYRLNTPGMNYWVTREGAVMDYRGQSNAFGVSLGKGHVVAMKFVGAGKAKTEIVPGEQRSYKTDFIGWGSKPTVRGVRSFNESTIVNVAPGVNMRHYMDGERARYDVILRPSASPKNVQIEFEGAEGVSVNEQGDLEIETSLGKFNHGGLYTYQKTASGQVRVDSRFKVLGKNRVGIEVGKYDSSKPLVIDPIVYGTYVGGDGGGGFEVVGAITTDNLGNVYMSGTTENADFPVISGPYDINLRGGIDFFLISLTGDAYDVRYSAYIGGSGVEGSQNTAEGIPFTFDQTGGLSPEAQMFLQVDQYGNLWMGGVSDSILFNSGSTQIIRPTTLDTTVMLNPSGTPSFGRFVLDYKGVATDVIPQNATATEVATALNNLPNVPPAGFTATGGPLPTTPITVNTTDALAHPLIAVCPTLPYTVANGDGSSSITFDPSGLLPTDPFFRPNAGFFHLRLIQNGTTRQPNTASTAPVLPWNASPAMVAAYLIAQYGLDPATVVAGGTALPAGTVNITWNTAEVRQIQMISAFKPSDDTASGIDPLNLRFQALNGGRYGVFNKTTGRRPVMMRFEPSASLILDPITNPMVVSVGGQNGPAASLEAFVVRPVPTANGEVELFLSGNVNGALPEIPGGSGTYLLKYKYNQTTKTIAVNPSGTMYFTDGLSSRVTGATMDSAGSVYVTGSVTGAGNLFLGPASTNFVTTNGIFTNGNLLRSRDAFIRKFDAAGNIVYSGVIGGNGNDSGGQVAVDKLGNAYLLLTANSFNFPRTPGTFGQNFPSAPTSALMKISPSGNQILYSTNLFTNGTFASRRLAIDSRGNAYIAGCMGFTVPFLLPAPTIPGSIPTTPVGVAVPGQEAAYDTTYTNGDANYFPVYNPVGSRVTSTTDGFLMVVNSTATGLLLSTYVGGAANEDIYALHLDATNSCYIGGFTGNAVFSSPGGLTGKLVPGSYGLPAGFITPLAFKSVPTFDEIDGFMVKLRVALPILRSLDIAPTSSAGGFGVTVLGQVTLQQAAPAGGTQVTVRVLNPNVARLSTSGATNIRVNVPEGATFATFLIYPRLVASQTFCDIRAELDGDFLIERLNVKPWIESFTLEQDEITGGNEVIGVVRLTQAAPAGGMPVSLVTDNPTLVGFAQDTVTIPEGQTSIQIPIETNGVSQNTDVNITATVQAVGSTTRLRLTPATVKLLSFNPTVVNGGEPSFCTIELDGEAAVGAVINLTKSGLPIFIPTSINLNAGDRSVTFGVNTGGNSGATGAARINATLNGVTTSGDLTIEANDILAVTLNEGSVVGGAVVTGTVQLSRPATQTGFRIQLVNTNPTAGTLSTNQVKVAPGATSASFTIQTNGVDFTQVMKVQAVKGGYSVREASLSVRAVNLQLSFNPSSVSGGGQTQGTVTLANNEKAPSGGLLINLTNNAGSLLNIPASVVIPAGQSSVSFLATAAVVGSNTDIQVTAATVGSGNAVATVRILGANLKTFTVTPSNPFGGSPVTGTITLESPAPAGGATLTVGTSNSALAQPPTTVTVPAGQTSVTFNIPTSTVASAQSVVITVSRGGTSIPRTLNLQVSVINLSSVIFNPPSVVGGLTSVGTITLDLPAPTGGTTVNLSADKPEFVTFPASVTVPAGSRTVNFNVVTTQVTREVGVIFTATLPSSGSTKQGTLFIKTNVGG